MSMVDRPMPASAPDPLEGDRLVMSIMAAVRATPQERPFFGGSGGSLLGRRPLVLATIALAVVLVVSVAVTVKLSGGSGQGQAAASATFHQDGIAFSYPTSWIVSPANDRFGILAFVGSVRATARCEPASSDTGEACHAFVASLGPNDVVVRVGAVASDWSELGRSGPFLRTNGPVLIDGSYDDGAFYGTARSIVVDGVPAKVATGPVVANRWLGAGRITTVFIASLLDLGRLYVVTIATSGTSGSAMDAHQAQVDALISSVRLDPPQ